MIDVNNESGELVDEQALERLARFVLKTMRIHRLADLSIVLVDEPTITTYNETFMDHTGPTDVLSFPMDELRAPADDEPAPRGLLGDILVCPVVAARQAARNGRTTRQEIEYLTVHGILHLLGYDHAEPSEHAVMFALNDRLIADWNASR
ncbi:MAG: rRNA maturation RNase YbeY [Propionibacteriaceae bacterium]|nr:rRNA maturation RNase YbeY [Propionibacteriaceae bacterium]